MKNVKYLICIVSFLVMGGSQVLAEDSPALEAAKEAASEQPAAVPAADPAPKPDIVTPAVPSPPAVEPRILKELQDHTPIPVRSSLDQAIDINNNRTLEYDEIKEYIKTVRSSISKNGKYPTNTDVLYHFDKNHDGYIDGTEISGLESHIR